MRCSTAIPLLLAAATVGMAAPATDDPWLQYGTPEAAGFSADRLDAARIIADSIGSGAVMAVYRGHVVAAWGDIGREFQLHSVRKSLVSALYGPAVEEGVIDPDATLASIGIDDDAGLTPAETQARIADLLAARSGIYLPAAYAPDDQGESRPRRGSHPPDTHWFYNNWDFNVAGVVYERLSGEPLFESFHRLIARPLGMEDFTPDDGYLVYEPTSSRHPAHTFRMSTRDLARFGQMILQDGRWEDRQVVPATWVRESLEMHSEFTDGTGYGWMWWIHPAGTSPERYPNLDRHDFFMARGTGGQALFVIPGADMVIVHRGDTDNGREIAGPHVWRLAEAILAARTSDPRPDPDLMSMAPVPLESQLPAPPPEKFLAASDAEVDELVGDYRMANGAVIRVFRYRGGLYGHVPGEGDAEMFRVGRDEWTVRVVPGVSIRFGRGDDGDVTALVLELEGQRIEAERVS